MSERYSKVYSLPENLYTQGSPVVIAAGALLKDNETGALIGQLKLHSISDKAIKLAKVELICLDSVGRALGSPITFDYLDLSVRRDADFGSQSPIRISNTATRSYTARVIEVGFSDNTVWHDAGGEWNPLPKQSKLGSSTALTGYKSFFGETARYLVCEYEDIWSCACGAINHSGEERCHKCGVFLNGIKEIDHETLMNEGIYVTASAKVGSASISDLEKAREELSGISGYKDSSELIESCTAKIEEIKNKKAANGVKIKKGITIGSIITGALAVLGVIGYFAIYPLISYIIGDYKSYIKVYGIKEFEIPDGVTSIGDFAFESCGSLTSVVIPDSVTSIGNSAFESCGSLTSVVIPDSVTSIGDSAFEDCYSLASVHISDIAAWCGIEFGGSFSNPLYYSKFYDNNLYLNGELLTELVIPEGVEKIADDAFSFCSGLTSIVIPNSVTSIGNSAFKSCDSLTSVVIPDSVTSIGDSAFSICGSLTSVVIGDSVTSIGDDAFYDCKSLTSVHISDIAAWCGIEFGGKYANPLYYAENLYLNGELLAGDLVIPDGVEKIGMGAFFRCSGLTSVVIPDSVTSIGDDAFAWCDSLTSVVIGDSVTSIGSDAFDYCISLTSVHISDIAAWCGIEFADIDANPLYPAENFYLNGELLAGDLVIPDGVERIGKYAFRSCYSLTSVVIGGSVTSIGDDAFCDCYLLTSIEIPDSVTSIGDDAFRGCDKLKIYYEGTESMWKAIKPSGIPYNAKVYYNQHVRHSLTKVPGKAATCTATGYNEYEFCSGCDYTTYVEIEKLEHIYNESYVCEICHYQCYSVGLDYYCYSSSNNCSVLGNGNCEDTIIFIPPTYNGYKVTGVGYMQSEIYFDDRVETIVIPDGVKDISYSGFKNASNLKEIFIPKTLTYIDRDAFINTKLTDVYYEGTEQEWNKVLISGGFDETILNATVHFNSDIEDILE